VKAAVQWLRGNAVALGIDPERIIAQGLSAGARLGAVAYTSGDDPWFTGPELWPGIADHLNGFVGYYSTYDGSLESDATYYGGERDDDDAEVRRRWAEADSLANAGDVVGPAYFFTGEDDWSLLIMQMEAFVDGVSDAGFDAESQVTSDGDHGYDQVGGDLTRAGEADLAVLLEWLDQQFPQS
jgi:acetyl esterase/lipase